MTKYEKEEETERFVYEKFGIAFEDFKKKVDI